MTETSVSPPALTTRPCGVCGAGERSLLLRQTFAALSCGTLLEGYDVVVCAGCGFGFADQLPPPEAFEAYYADMSKYEHQDTGGQVSSFDRQRFAQTADVIARVLPDPDAPILDIGCATGGLLAAVRERGYTSLLGVDPSPTCARLAGEAFGIRAVCGTLASAGEVKGPFALVILAHVLEHLYAPGSALTRVRELLGDGGLLLVEVPDATRFADWLDAPFQQFSTEHINFFSPVSLANLLAAGRFTPLLTAQHTIAVSALSRAPILSVVAQRAQRGAQSFVRDCDTGGALQAYIGASTELEHRIARRIADLADSRRPILVWGVGTHTMHLLATTRLGEANIRAFVDSNPNYHGKELRGIPILPPQAVCGRDEAILISSAVSQREIVQQIRDRLGCRSDLICFYGEGTPS